MKDVNAYWRQHGTCFGAPGITDAQAEMLERRISEATENWAILSGNN
jgi:hypothetical protein